jgi:hypothetical protein
MMSRVAQAVGRLLTAWGACLAASLPAPVAGLFGRSTLRVPATKGGLTVMDGPLVVAAPSKGQARRALLVAPAEAVLVKRLWLPKRALAELDAVIRHDVVATTPFAFDDIVHAARLAETDGDRCLVELALIERSTLENLREQAGRALPAVPDRVELAPGLSTEADPEQRQRKHKARRLDGLLAVLAFVSACLVAMLAERSLDQREHALREAIAAMLAERRQAEATEAGMARLRERIGLVDRRQAQAHSMASAFAAAASALPAEARLDRLLIAPHEATVVFRHAPADAAAIAATLGEALLGPHSRTNFDAASNTLMLQGSEGARP